MKMATGTATGEGSDCLKNESGSNNLFQKNMIVKEMNQLNVRMKNLEKEKISHLYNRRSQYREIFVQLEEGDQKFLDSRKHEFQRLYSQINKVKSMVVRFRRELDDIKASPQFVERLKLIMEEIEDNISSFKEHQRLKYDELLHEEKALSTEIEALERKFDAWISKDIPDSAPLTSCVPLKSARDVNKSLPSEVAAFNKFLQQTGGPRGGWDEYDHATFLKLKLKHKNPAIFLQEACHSLPTRTEEQITEHITWYQEYLKMQNLKKLAIAKWKEEKNVEKDEKLTHVEKALKEEKLLEKQREDDHLKQIETEKQMNREKLQTWKEDQRKHKELEEFRKRREADKKVAEEKARRRRQEELRQQVDEFKQKKAEESEYRSMKEVEQRLAEDEERRRLIAERAGHIQERTKQMLDAKKAAAEAKQQAEQEKELRLEKLRGQVKVDVSSDPSRLLKLTEGWKERRKQSNDDSSSGRMYSMPRRAIPSWRQNVH